MRDRRRSQVTKKSDPAACEPDALRMTSGTEAEFLSVRSLARMKRTMDSMSQASPPHKQPKLAGSPPSAASFNPQTRRSSISSLAAPSNKCVTMAPPLIGPQARDQEADDQEQSRSSCIGVVDRVHEQLATGLHPCHPSDHRRSAGADPRIARDALHALSGPTGRQ